MKIDFSTIESALATLEAALSPPPRNDRERDGAIQRFEYTFELSWKLGQRVLREHGIESLSPKTVIRDLAQQGWIDEAAAWMEFHRARNSTSHTYNVKTADEVFQSARAFAPACRKLLAKLKANAKA